MNQPVSYSDKEAPLTWRVLKRLWEFQALTYGQIAQLEFGGDKRKTYDLLRRLYENGLIAPRRNPANQRIAYAVLTTKGAWQVAGETVTWNPPRRDRVVRLLAFNDLYCKLTTIGIPPDAISRRRDALQDLGVMPMNTRLVVQVVGREKTWLLYLREKGFRKILLRGASIVSPEYAHVILYEGSPARDMRVFLTQSLPQHFHCLQMDQVQDFKTLAFEPETLLKRIEVHISPHRQGKLVRLSDCPFEYAWEEPDGSRIILADLSTNNLGPVAVIRDLDMDFAAHPSRNWGKMALIFAKDEKSAARWRNLIGHKERLWMIRCDLPPGQSLFRSGALRWERWERD